MFEYQSGDDFYKERPVAPELVRRAMQEVLKAVKVRIAFVGYPSEPRYLSGGADWSKEVTMVEHALELLARGAEGADDEHTHGV